MSQSIVVRSAADGWSVEIGDQVRRFPRGGEAERAARRLAAEAVAGGQRVTLSIFDRAGRLVAKLTFEPALEAA